MSTDIVCGICSDSMVDLHAKYRIKLTCGHEYHYGCLHKTLKDMCNSGQSIECPYCRYGLSKMEKQLLKISVSNYQDIHKKASEMEKEIVKTWTELVGDVLSVEPDVCNMILMSGKRCNKKSTIYKKHGSNLNPNDPSYYFCRKHLYMIEEIWIQNQSGVYESMVHLPFKELKLPETVYTMGGYRKFNQWLSLQHKEEEEEEMMLQGKDVVKTL